MAHSKRKIKKILNKAFSEVFKDGSFCQKCGKSKWRHLGGGGCGGIGVRKGCLNCRAVYEQTSGGINPTHGGEVWSLVPRCTMKDDGSVEVA